MTTSQDLDPGRLRELAETALRLVEQLPEVEGKRIYRVYEPRLADALDPLRGQPALEILCGGSRGGRCSKRLAWWALDREAAFIAATERRAKPKERHGGIFDLARPSRREKSGLSEWIELAERGDTSVRLVDVKSSGFPLRLKFVCADCRGDYTTTNTTRLRLFLKALSTGRPVLLGRDLK